MIRTRLLTWGALHSHVFHSCLYNSGIDYLTRGKLGAGLLTPMIWKTGQLSSWICAYGISTQYMYMYLSTYSIFHTRRWQILCHNLGTIFVTFRSILFHFHFTVGVCVLFAKRNYITRLISIRFFIYLLWLGCDSNDFQLVTFGLAHILMDGI